MAEFSAAVAETAPWSHVWCSAVEERWRRACAQNLLTSVQLLLESGASSAGSPALLCTCSGALTLVLESNIASGNLCPKKKKIKLFDIDALANKMFSYSCKLQEERDGKIWPKGGPLYFLSKLFTLLLLLFVMMVVRMVVKMWWLFLLLFLSSRKHLRSQTKQK